MKKLSEDEKKKFHGYSLGGSKVTVDRFGDREGPFVQIRLEDFFYAIAKKIIKKTELEGSLEKAGFAFDENQNVWRAPLTKGSVEAALSTAELLQKTAEDQKLFGAPLVMYPDDESLAEDGFVWFQYGDGSGGLHSSKYKDFSIGYDGATGEAYTNDKTGKSNYFMFNDGNGWDLEKVKSLSEEMASEYIHRKMKKETKSRNEEIEFNGKNAEKIRELLADTNVAAVQLNEYPFNGKFFLVGEDGKPFDVFAQDKIRVKDGTVERQKPSILGNETAVINPLEEKWQKVFFESKGFENIMRVFHPWYDADSVYKTLSESRSDAENYYEKSVARSKGYSYNDYLASQSARELLEEKYPHLEEYSDKSGALADWIGLQIVDGTLKTLNEVENKLGLNTPEVTEMLARSLYHFHPDEKLYAQAILDASEKLGWRFRENKKPYNYKVEFNMQPWNEESEWIPVTNWKNYGVDPHELAEEIIRETKEKFGDDSPHIKRIMEIHKEYLRIETYNGGTPSKVYSTQALDNIKMNLRELGFVLGDTDEREESDFTYDEIDGLFRLAHKVRTGFRLNSITKQLEYKSDFDDPNKTWKTAKLSENIREIMQMARGKISEQTQITDRLGMEADMKNMEKMAAAIEKREALGEKLRDGKIVHIVEKKGKKVFEAVIEETDDGREMHYKDSSGAERWTEYNEKGQEIRKRGADGYDSKTEYDERGNKIRFSNTFGVEESFEYNDKGLLVHKKNNFEGETWYEYREDGTLKYQKNSWGGTWERRYNENGDEIKFKSNIKNGIPIEIEKEYDASRNLVREKSSAGQKIIYEYDRQGNCVHSKKSDETGELEIWNKYDKNGNLTESRDSYGGLFENKYDKNGNLVYRHNNIENLKEWMEYDKYGNLVHEKDSRGYDKKTEYLPVTEKTLAMFDSLGSQITESKNMETEKEIENEKKDFGIKYGWDSFPEEKFQTMMEHIADKSVRNKTELIGSIDVNGIPASIEILHGDGSDFSESDPDEYGNEKTLRVSLPGYVEYTATVTPSNIDLESYEGFKLYVQESIIEEMAEAALQKDRLKDSLDNSEFTEKDFSIIKDEAMTGEATDHEGEFLGRIKAGLIDVDIRLYHEEDGGAFIDLQGYYPITDLSMSVEDADDEAYAWQGKYSNALPYKEFYVGTILDIKDKVTDYDSFTSLLKAEITDMLLDEETRLGNDAFGLKNSEIMSLAESDETWDSLTAKWIEKRLEPLLEYKKNHSGISEDAEYREYDNVSRQIDGLMKDQLELYFSGKSDILLGNDPEKFAEYFKEHAIKDDIWNAERIALDGLESGRTQMYHAVCHNFESIDPFFVEDHLAQEISKPNPDTGRIRKIIASCKNEGIDDEITGMDFEIPYRAAISKDSGLMHAVLDNMTDEEKLEFMDERDGYDKVKIYYAKQKDGEKSLGLFEQYAESCGYMNGKKAEEIIKNAVSATHGFDIESAMKPEQKITKKVPSKTDNTGIER